MVSWKKRTVTPVGGWSVIERVTGTVEEFGFNGDSTGDWLPHPNIIKTRAAIRRDCIALSIFPS